MMAMEGRFKDELGTYNKSGEIDKEYAQALVHGEAYHKTKGEIMEPINEFFQMVESRTQLESAEIRDKQNFYLMLSSLLVGLAILLCIFARFHFSQFIILPIRTLIGWTKHIESGKYKFDVKKIAQDELGILTHAFANMAAKISSQICELERLASKDGLTNLFNRRVFDEYIEKQCCALARNQRQMSLIMVDIDHFKQYNDHYGHQAGDECLVTISWILQQSILRPADIVARYGGEEFVCLLPETDIKGALDVASRINQHVKDVAIPHAASPVENYVTLSMGIASLVPDDENSAQELVMLADEKLFQAKQQGRNRVVS